MGSSVTKPNSCNSCAESLSQLISTSPELSPRMPIVFSKKATVCSSSSSFQVFFFVLLFVLTVSGSGANSMHIYEYHWLTPNKV